MAEGFGNVVIGAQFQTFSDIGIFTPDRQHQYRYVREAAYLSQDAIAVHVRQADIKNDNIRAFGFNKFNSFMTVIRMDDAGAAPAQLKTQGDNLYNPGVILNNQNFHITP